MSGLAFDTIVVGAGPAGSSAARALSVAGQKVLLLDVASFPRKKPCGGLMPGKSGGLIGPAGMAVVDRQFDRVLVRIGAHGVEELPEPVLLVDRREFDLVLMREAEQAGAECRIIAGVQSVTEDGGVVLTTRDGCAFRARTLVGCDGSSSAIARSVGVVRSGPRPFAVVADVPLERCPPCVTDRPPLFDFLALEGGYAWTFARSTHLSIGTYGVQPVQTLKNALSVFARAEGVPLPATFGGAPIETRRAAVPAGMRSILLAGDAAGLADHFTGGGLHSALLSGRLAARAILEGEGGDVAALYQFLLQPLRVALERQRALAQHVYRTVPTKGTLSDLVRDACPRPPAP